MAMRRESEGLLQDDSMAQERKTTRVILRVEHLISHLFPVAIGEDEVTTPTSWVITPQVLDSFARVAQDDEGGPFIVPYALLCARARFAKAARNNPADFDEEMLHRTACSTIASRLLARFDEKERDLEVLTRRWRHLTAEGQLTMPENSIELAIDSRDTLFLSSNRVQNCINAIWRGDLMQYTTDNGERRFKYFENAQKPGVFRHFDCFRVSVPRYQNIISIALSIIWLIVYSISIADPDRSIDLVDIVLYFFIIGTAVDFGVEVAKVGLRTIDVWQIFNLIMIILYLASFGIRTRSFMVEDVSLSNELGRTSYRVLASLAPLMYIRLLVVLDNFSVFGSLEVVLSAMLREAVVFFALLGVVVVGFLQAFIGLDSAEDTDGDNGTSAAGLAVRIMLKGLLQSPDFDASQSFSIFGEVLYHIYVAIVALIFLNILISVFNTSYSDIVEDSMEHYLANFAGRTIAYIRAPDTYSFLPPFNIIEAAVLVPLSLLLNQEWYDKISRWTMTVLYFVPLCAIAIYEGRYDAVRQRQRKQEEMEDEDERREARSNTDLDAVHNEEEMVDEFLHRTQFEREILKEGGSQSVKLCRDLRSKLKPANATQGEKTHSEVVQLRSELAELKALLKEKLK